MPLHVSNTCAHHQVVKIALHNLWYHHTYMCDDTIHTTYAAALKTTTNPKTRYRKPYAATQHLALLMVGVCTRNMSR
jgi:hypothetical protein